MAKNKKQDSNDWFSSSKKKSSIKEEKTPNPLKQKTNSTSTVDERPVNASLLNMITPIGLEFKRNSLVVGENSGRIYGVVKYPQKVEYGWLSRITNIPGTIVSVGFKPIDNSTFVESLSRNIIQHRSTADSAKDPLAQQRAERAASDGERIMRQIDQHGETVGQLSIAVMPISREDETFTKVCRKVESVFALCKCKLRGLANLQADGFKQLSPF